MLRPELVSPAGNFTKLKIALAYGADAVYAGVNNFSLRAATAREFDYESFAEAVAYTHQRGKKIYATLNGFYLGGQLPGLARHISRLAELAPDGLIIAGLGTIKLAHELAPQIPIHISTQANVLNHLDAKVYAGLGACRIVLARELGLKDAREIHAKTGLTLEAFVQGSMCFAYSGRCLISSVQSGRMSNRGACANDCRFGYELYARHAESGTVFRLEEDERGTHVFNSKDLNLASQVERIMREDCVGAFKIEGRTKSEYYCAVATHAYRQAIDDALAGCFEPAKYERELATLAGRGYTDGYLINRAYEREDTQNFQTSFLAGSHRVEGFSEDGAFFKCKGHIVPGEEYELLTPVNSPVPCCDNELGRIYEREGHFFVEFKRLVARNKKIFGEIHSGNIHEIALPARLGEFSFLRKKLAGDEGSPGQKRSSGEALTLAADEAASVGVSG